MGTHLQKGPSATPTPSTAEVGTVADAIPEQQPLPSAVPVPTSKQGAIKGRILMYHYIRSGVDKKKDPIGYGLSVSSAEFEGHLVALQALGYREISLADLMAGKGDDRSVTLTFDDGYEDFYTTAYPILKKHGWKATLYIITGMIGGDYMTWDQISELQKDGFEIGAHSVTHPALSSLSEARQHSEIFESKKTLEQQLGIQIHSFCYPSGKYNQTTIQLVQAAGYTDATTTQPGPIRSLAGNQYTLTRYRMSPGMGIDSIDRLFR